VPRRLTTLHHGQKAAAGINLRRRFYEVMSGLFGNFTRTGITTLPETTAPPNTPVADCYSSATCPLGAWLGRDI
jgi:hypothetical protein